MPKKWPLTLISHWKKPGKSPPRKQWAIWQGINTPDNYFYTIEREENAEHEQIGYLWYPVNREDRFAWLDGIELFAPFQNQGYGVEVLGLAEVQLAAQGIRSMSLQVAGTNQRAQRFYQRNGYKITGYNMKKNW
ncbi:MAG: GNAT family N-acetyltransferase [Caldilineaceae bacterium]